MPPVERVPTYSDSDSDFPTNPVPPPFGTNRQHSDLQPQPQSNDSSHTQQNNNYLLAFNYYYRNDNSQSNNNNTIVFDDKENKYPERDSDEALPINYIPI